MSLSIISKTGALPKIRGLYPAIVLIGLIFLLSAPFLGIYPIFLMKVLCFALMASAFNLMLGYVGLLSFGHAAFFGIGAYVLGHTIKEWGIPPLAALPMATATAALMGFIFGAIAIRQKGIYFAMITMALGQLVYFVCVQAPFTNGEDGIQAIPRGTVLGILDLSETLPLYYFVLAIFVLGLLAIYRTVNSPLGQALRGVKENEQRMISLGYPVARMKILAFTISAALTGLAGATKAIVFQTATLTDVQWQTSGEAVLMTLIGGIGTLFGPVVGAAIVIGIQSRLAWIGSWMMVIVGVIFVICVMSFRKGIVGTLMASAERAGSERAKR